MRTAQRIAVESVRNLVARVSQLVSSETFPRTHVLGFAPSLASFGDCTVSTAGNGICSLVVVVCVDPRWRVSPRLKLYQVVVREAVASLSLLDNCDVR